MAKLKCTEVAKAVALEGMAVAGALAEAVAWTGAGAEAGEGGRGTVALTDLPSDAAVAAVGGARRAGRVAVVTAAPAQLRRIGVVVEEGTLVGVVAVEEDGAGRRFQHGLCGRGAQQAAPLCFSVQILGPHDRAQEIAPPGGRPRDGRRHDVGLGDLPHARASCRAARPSLAHVHRLDPGRRARAARRLVLRRAHYSVSAGRRQVCVRT